MIERQMGARTRVILALVLLLLAGSQFAGAALQPTACDDDCSPGCGDCAACPLVASLTASLAVVPTPARVDSVGTLAAAALPCRARGIEHVPLALPS